jgi:hypothetical protein
MGINGTFGYIIGNKKRLTAVNNDADYLWQILLRELYVLLHHYGTVENLQREFEKIKVAKKKYILEAVEKCKIFTDLDVNNQSTEDWYCLLRGCQSSFINLLEAEFINTVPNARGYTVIVDFNKKEVFYYNDEGSTETDKYGEYKLLLKDTVKLSEINSGGYHFQGGPPTKTFTEIINEFRERFDSYRKSIQELDDKIKIVEQIQEKEGIHLTSTMKPRCQYQLNEYKYKKSKLKRERNEFGKRFMDLNMVSEYGE